MSDPSTWLDDNSGGGGYPGVYFGRKGDTVKGVILSKPRIVTVTNDRGIDEQRLVVELKALDGCTADHGKKGADGVIQAGTEVSLWVKPGLMASAISDAVKAADAKGLAEGDTLAVQFSDEKETGKPQPAKVYTAAYAAAKPAVSLNELI